MMAMVKHLPRSVGVILLMVPGVCLAQKYVPPPPPLTVDPCAVQPNAKFPVAPDPKAKPPVCPPPGTVLSAPAATGAAPAAADAFPFPGDAAPVKPAGVTAAKPSAADQFPFPGSTPAAAPAAAKPGSAGDQFPYPGETNKSPDAVPEGNTPRYVPDSPASGSGSSSSQPMPGSPDNSSSSSSSSSGSDALPSGGDDAAKSEDDAAPVKPRHRLPKVSAQSPDDRVTEDLNVARFYSAHGNFEAAYLRSKDATKAMPDDAESHFALAQAAEKLRKKDEAAAEYALYLKLDPSGEKTALAQKALAGLQ